MTSDGTKPGQVVGKNCQMEDYEMFCKIWHDYRL